MNKYRINLVTKKKEDFVDKLVYFALHYLRYIIVLTQIVVIGVFFFRFQVDQEIIDLKENIAQKEEIFNVTTSIITEAKEVNKKITDTKSVLNRQLKFSHSFDYLLSTIPEEIVLKKMNLDDKHITIDGLATNINIIKIFIEKVKYDKQFKSIVLSTIKRESSGLSFAINIDI